MLLRAACRRPPCEHQPTLRSEAGPVATPDSIGLDASLKVRKDTEDTDPAGLSVTYTYMFG
jgi:hypothetical protein